MAPSIPHSIYERLPTPVARLLRLAALSKDLKKRHDYAFAAWDVTFRLVVAAAPPEDISSLREPSLGNWRQALRLQDTRSDAPELVQFIVFLKQQLELAGKPPRYATPQHLVEHLPAYRNRFTTAHASPREDAFYTEATRRLVEALGKAWEVGFFWDADDKLLFVPDIEVDEEGRHRARVIEMTGPSPYLLEEGVVVPDDIRKGRVYLRKQGQFRSLHPWIVFRLHEIKQHLLLFNSSNRGYQFLDCDSGEIWSESQLVNYGLSAADFSLLPPLVAPREEAPSAVSTKTPLPVEEPSSGSSQASIPVSPSPHLAAVPRATPAPGVWRHVALVLSGVLAVGVLVAFVLLPGNWGIPAVSDWFFKDTRGGNGWRERCRKHLDSGAPRLAEVACRKGLQLATEPAVRGSLWSHLAEIAWLKQDAENAVRASLEAYASHPTPGNAGGIEKNCQRAGLPGPETGLQDSIKVIAVAGAQVRKEPKGNGLEIRRGTCLSTGPAAVRFTEGAAETWFEVARLRDGRTERGWVRESEVVPPPTGEEWLARCDAYFLGGMVDPAIYACERSTMATQEAALLTRAHQIAAVALLQKRRSPDALEHLIEAYKSASQETAKDEIAKLIDHTCAEQNSPPRTEGDSRRYKVVSWRSGSDRFANLRNEPSTLTSTSRILGALARPTCVLAEPAQKIIQKNGLHEFWFPVEASLAGVLTKGWMHQILLAP